MESENNELAAIVGAVTDRRRRTRKDHPSSETLSAYHSGLLAGVQVEKIRDHLEVCPTCTGQLLEMAASDDADLSAEALLPKEQVDADFGKLRKRLVTAGVLSAGVIRTEKDVGAGSGKVVTFPRTVALVASLLVCLALSVWVWVLKNGLSTHMGPRGNVQIVDLVPIGEGIERSTIGPDEELSFPTEAPALVLILNLSDSREYPKYEAEIIRDGEPGERRIISDLQRSEEGNFTLEISRDALPAGDYRIILRGITSNTQEVLLAEYSTTLSYEHTSR